MGYLEQLKNISKVQDDEPKETKELPKPNCLGFLGSVLKNIHAAEARQFWLLSPTASRWPWLLPENTDASYPCCRRAAAVLAHGWRLHF
jgi:hypothetical protein